MLAVIEEPPDGEASGPEEQEVAPDADPATIPASSSLTPEQVEARYAFGEKHGFDHAGFDAAGQAAMDRSVADMDDSSWRAFAITVKGGAIATTAAPDAPGDTEAASVGSDTTTIWQTPEEPDDGMAARIARAEARARGEKP